MTRSDRATRRVRRSWWDRLERWSPTAFMLGGASIAAVLPLIFVVQAGTDGLLVLAAVVFLVGAAAIITGMLGLQPRLAGSAPTLARLAAAVVLVLVGLTVLALLTVGTLTVLGDGLGLNVPAAPEFGLATPPLFGAIILGHVIFGVASLRTAIPSRLFGGLLIALAGLWILGFVVGTRSQEFDHWDLIATGIPAVGTIVAGYLLRAAPTRTPTGSRDPR